METRLASKFVHMAFAAAILGFLSGAAGAQAPQPWGLTGNAGTDPVKNFLGTTDADGRPLIIQPGAGNVGIGTTSPKDKLTVNGNSTVGKAQSSAGAAATYIYDEGSGYMGFLKRGTSQTGNMGLGNNASEIVSTSGNLGLYTYTPGAYLALGTKPTEGNATEHLRVASDGTVSILRTNYDDINLSQSSFTIENPSGHQSMQYFSFGGVAPPHSPPWWLHWVTLIVALIILVLFVVQIRRGRRSGG